MIDARVIIKEPVSFRGLCEVYAPTVRQVITTENFSVYKKALTLSQEDIEDELAEQKQDISKAPLPFEYLLSSSFHNKQIEEVVKNSFLFFIHEPITILYDKKKILLGDLEKELKEIKSVDELRFIDEENFFDFQNLIRNMCGEDSIDPPNPNEHPKIKRMKAKARYRDKIKAKKNGLSLDTILLSICCMGIGITPLTIGELSYATAIRLMNIYQEKEKYNVDVQSLLAGAKADEVKIKYWIHNPEK